MKDKAKQKPDLGVKHKTGIKQSEAIQRKRRKAKKNHRANNK